MEWYNYILRSSKTGEFYKGFTDNIERRLRQHISGKVKSTKGLLPLELIHIEICKSKKEARQLEVFFKSGYGREIVKEIAEKV